MGFDDIRILTALIATADQDDQHVSAP